MTKSIKQGIEKKGFAMIEAITQCPVQFGRVSKQGSAVNMLKHYKQNGIRIEKAAKMDAAELQGKIVEGEFVNLDKPELVLSIAAALKEGTGGNK
jgi:2-oxoglutarate ferredoxin oxidoreductase subunit beta